jgi:hypothetical protein
MSEPEQIGPLLFVPNESYPYPFDVPVPPRFWMEEQTGLLADAVNAYIEGERLPAAQLELVRLYLRQYLERAILPGDANRARLLERIPKLETSRAIELFTDELAEYGVEPF